MASAAEQSHRVFPSLTGNSAGRALAGSVARLAAREGTLAGVLIVGACVLRVALTMVGWPTLNSDEALFGITALHIARAGAHPVYAYGEWYLGDIEAYLAAVFIRFFGASLLTLRVGLIGMFGLFLASMYGLTALLYNKRAALVALVVLGLGPAELLFHELSASGGYPETLLFGSVMLLLAAWLAVTSGDAPRAATRWRAAAFAGWGLAAGLGVWSDPIVLPEVLAAGLLLLAFCWRQLLGWRGALLVAGCAIGLLPAILYNLSAPPDMTTIAIVRAMESGEALGSTVTPQTSLLGTFLVSLPNMTGGSVLCQPATASIWPLPPHMSASAMQCLAMRTAWGVGFVMLWVLAGVLACWRLVRLARGAAISEPVATRRQAAAVQAGRLAVLGGALITLAIYAHSPDSGLDAVANSRYLFPLMIAFPVALGPLFDATYGRMRSMRGRPGVLQVLGAGAIACICAVFLAGTVQTFQAAPSTVTAVRVSQQQLASDLERIGATRIYSEYWTCYSLAFVSRERIICALVNPDLSPGRDRVPTYRATVRVALDPAYVFPIGSPEVAAMAHKVAPAGKTYQRLVMDGYVVYRLVPR